MLKSEKSRSLSLKEANSDMLFDKEISGGFCTSKEAAEYLRTTPKQIRNWVYQGRLIHYKLLGRKLLFRKKDLDALLQKKGGILCL